MAAVLVALAVAGLVWVSLRSKKSRVSPQYQPDDQLDLPAATTSGADRAMIQRYFDSFTAIEKRAKSGDHDGAYQIAVAALEHLSLVARDLDCPFRSPPLQYVCDHLALKQDRAGLESLLAQVTQTSELSHFAAVVRDALADLALLGAVLRHVQGTPGCLQKTLGKTLCVDGRRAAHLLKKAEAYGLVRREAANGTYAIYITAGTGAHA